MKKSKIYWLAFALLIYAAVLVYTFIIKGVE
jgi:hypothetical protein